MKEEFRYLIVDDESLARESIKVLMEPMKSFQLIGECKDGQEAIHTLEQHVIDLIFFGHSNASQEWF